MRKVYFYHYKLSHMWWDTKEGADLYTMKTTKCFDICSQRIRKGLAFPLYIRWRKRNESYLTEYSLSITFLLWIVIVTSIRYSKDVEVL